MVGKNETSQQMRRSKESNVAANKLKDIPEALQEFKNHLGDGAAENIMERTQIAEKKEEKQSNNVDRASHKRKSENNDKLAVEEEETMLETGNQLIPTPLSHIPLKTLTDIEMELVYTDEEEISFEFAKPVASTSTQSACRDAEKADALSTPNSSALPYIDEQLQMTLREASNSYREKNYEAAVEQFSTALELFSKGAATDDTLESSPEDISSIASFIETKLVTCYLKLRKLDEALNHSHRSIILNPAYFRNHLRQAAAFRCLERYSEAARSTMIADYMYWLTGGTEQHTSKLIKLYWQAMIEEAIAREVSFSVMYTPCVTEVKADKINKIKDLFAKKHPDYVEHIYTDVPCIVVTARPKFIPISVDVRRSPMVIPAAEPSLPKNILPSTSTNGLITAFESISAAGMGIDGQVSFSLLKTNPHGFHFLPQTAGWPSLPPQRYLLTLGFRNKCIGKILERWSSKKLPIFSDQKAPFSPLTKEETKRYWDNTGKKIVPVMDFIRSTKLTDNLCACSRGIEKLHYASFLSRLQRVEEQSQVINQAMAELATIPYLQDISQQDAELLQSLMADAMDTLEGRSDKGRVWNKIQKIGLIEDYLYQVEDNYLKNKRLRTARREKMKRTQSTQQH